MISKVALLPAVNRNQSHVFDKNEDGLVAFGARCSIYIMDFRLLPPIILDDRVIHNGHRDKVISLSFCKANNSLLASIGEDSHLKTWDIETGANIANLKMKEHSRVVEWLYDSINSVVFPDFYGFVAKWNFITNKYVSIKTCSSANICELASNPKSPELLAVGHENGTISILNINNDILLYALRSHSEKISSLSWSPVISDVLLSTSLDMSARLWKLGEYNPKIYYYPSTRNKFDDKKHMHKNCCGMCHPDNPDTIICSNVRGDLGSVTFKENESPKFISFTNGGKYPDTNFKSVVTILPYILDKDGKKKHMFLTLDHLKITLWDTSEQKPASIFSCTIGGIFDLSSSMLNPNMLAIGCGDGVLRTCDTTAKDSPLINIYVNHKIKIMTVSWHPVEEHLLAYGADDGRVGVADTFKKKSLYSYETHHGASVYSLQWGPCLKLKNTKLAYFLYSCGSGIIYINELDKPKEKAVEFNTLVQLSSDLENSNHYSEISWKSDYTCFVVGSYKGYVDFFDNEFNFLTRITLQMKNVESLKWHPIVTMASPEGSLYKSWLGVAGNCDVIHVIDTSAMDGQSTICKSTKTLIGHKKRVFSICWSQHIDGQLLSGSRDGTVQVWNVCTNSLLANYPYHKEIVHAVYWSITDPDVVYSGGLDNSLRIWNISQQKETSPPSKSLVIKYKPPTKLPKMELEYETKELNNTERSSISISKTETNKVVTEASKTITEADFPAIWGERIQNRGKRTKQCEPTNVLFPKKSGHLFSEFNYKDYSKEEYLKDFLKLVDHLCSHQKEDFYGEMSEKLSQDFILKFGFFTDQKTAMKMLESKAQSEANAHHTLHTHHAKYWYLNLMTCNVKPLLMEAAETNQLNDFLVAMSPSVSIAFWKEMCEKFAFQLVGEQQYMRASLYLMYSDKLYEAIKLLLDKERVLEALALAKVHLPEDDDILKLLFQKSVKYFSSLNVVELEASCHLSMKNPLMAAKALYCVADSKYIYAAVYVCSQFKFKEQAEEYGYICMETCLSHNDWQTFYQLIEIVESLKVYTSLIRIHELLCSHIKVLRKEDGLIANDIFGVNDTKVLIWSGKVNETNLPFLEQAKQVLISEGIIYPEDKETLKRIHEALNFMDNKRKNFEVSAEAHICVAMCATQTIITTLLGDLELARQYFSQIFITAYGIVFLPKVVNWIFLPFNVYYEKPEIFDCEFKYESPNMLHFASFYSLFCSKLSITCLSTPEELNNYDKLSDLEIVVEIALRHLSKLHIEDGLLLYFFSTYLNELRRVTKKGWKYRCYKKVITYSTVGDHVKSQIQSCDIVENSVVKHDSNSILQKLDALIHSDKKEVTSEEFPIKLESTNAMNNIIKLESENAVREDISNKKLDSNCDINNETMPLNAFAEVTERFHTITQSDANNREIMTNGQNCVVDEDKVPVMVSKTERDKIAETELKDLIKSILKEAELKAEQIVNSIQQKDADVSDEIVSQNAANICNTVSAKIEEKNNLNNKENHKADNNQNIKENFQHHQIVESAVATGKCDGKANYINLKCDSHEQCWKDVALCYSLTNSIKCLLCKDEYALFHYLEHYLGDIDAAIATNLRKQVAAHKSQNIETLCQAVHDSEEKKIAINKKQLKLPKNFVQFEEHFENSVNLDVAKEESDLLQVTNEIHIRNTSIETNSSDLQSVSNFTANIDGKLNSNAIISNTDAFSQIKVMEQKNEDHADLLCENSVNEIISDSEIDNSQCIVNETSSMENGIAFGGKILSPGELLIERRRILEQINLLKSVKVNYPNPFDAVANIVGICYDIFHKNPCEIVQEKFHDTIHEILKWRKKFDLKQNNSICEICQTPISA